MEFADNGDLFQKITNCQNNGTWINESDVWHIFIQTVRGLRALHDLKILHRDMKVNYYNHRVRMSFCSKIEVLNWVISM